MMIDKAHRETDDLLENLEKELTEAYAKAAQEIREKLEDYMRRFEAKDEKWRLWVARGEKTQEEYQAWRKGQLMMQDRWAAMRDTLAHDLAHADEIAQKIINGKMADVYSLNVNFATYQIEHDLGMSTSFTLYSKDTVAELLKKDPKLLPQPKVDIPADLRWNTRRLQSAMLQGVLQGESIPKIAKRVAEVTADGNIGSAIRNARTMITYVENAGRDTAYHRAASKGVKIQKTWLATLDMRTRHEHRVLDGQTVDIDEPFEVEGEEIAFPGDPSAPGYLVYNCRCRTIGQVKGFERDIRGFDLRADPAVEDMTYEEWKESRTEKPRSITHQKEVAETMRAYYYGKYAKP